MARGGRRKVWVCTQRDRENKRFLKKVAKTAKAALPNKRTRRKIMKVLLSSPSPSYNYVPERREPTPKKTPQKTIYDLSKAQMIAAWTVGVAIFIYVFLDFRRVIGTQSDYISSGVVISALFALLGGSFAGFIIYFFNLVTRKEPVPIEAPVDESISVPPVPESQALNEELLTAEINAPLYMAQFKDSLQIMKDTANPDTFFSRFDLAKERLESMAEYEKLGIKFTGSPSSLIKEFENEENIADTVNYLIDNAYKKQIQKISTLKTERGRSNSNQRWYASFEPYFDRIPSRSKEYLDLKLVELKEV